MQANQERRQMGMTLSAQAVQTLNTPDSTEKATRSLRLAKLWLSGQISEVGRTAPPRQPARPDKPVLLPPNKMPKRRSGGTHTHRVALLHALAHIELNAIDLAWDLIARFTRESMPVAFFDDWTNVAEDEAKHFLMLSGRLADLGAAYGDLPAHNGLWDAATDTAHDILARLAIVPLILEARGLDVTPSMITKLRQVGDDQSACVLEVIYKDEIKHVATGKKWFDFFCEQRKLSPNKAWHHLKNTYFKGKLKPPFNEKAREQAGLDRNFYLFSEESYL